MNNEILINELNDIVSRLDQTKDKYAVTKLENLIKKLKEEIYLSYMKTRGNSDIYKAVKRIIKSAQKLNNFFAEAVKTENGKQYICDGYRCVKLYQPLELEESTDKETKPLDYEKVFQCVENNMEKVDLPELSKLKAAVKIHKAEYKGKPKDYNPGILPLGENKPFVNSQYLLDMMEALPDCECYCSEYHINQALYFKAENGEGFLFPIRINSDSKTNFLHILEN